MKTLIVVLVLVFIAVPSFACDHPEISCKPVICQCDNSYTLPGLWEVRLGVKLLCGEVVIIGGSSAMVNGEVLLLNKIKVMKQTEVCD